MHKKSDADALVVVAVPVTTTALPDGCWKEDDCLVGGIYCSNFQSMKMFLIVMNLCFLFFLVNCNQ